MSQTDPFQAELTPADAGREMSHEEFATAEFASPWRFERVGGKLVSMSY